ncbi:interferon-gamma-inducible GTPase 10-like [Acropora palmata]|uniref:interferon-gamma-inducible GTPase 10-like n=1 Tax=Acropora palmata TaxID=6131 RepID=UPI003DA1B7D1
METYTKKVELEKYDAFLIFTATRFTENSLQLAVKIKSMKRKFIFIRSKIDNSARAESRKRSFDEQGMLTKIRRKCLERLGDLLSCEEDVFLISSHHPNKWDFYRLREAIFDAVIMLQEQESLTLRVLQDLVITS